MQSNPRIARVADARRWPMKMHRIRPVLAALVTLASFKVEATERPDFFADIHEIHFAAFDWMIKDMVSSFSDAPWAFSVGRGPPPWQTFVPLPAELWARIRPLAEQAGLKAERVVSAERLEYDQNPWEPSKRKMAFVLDKKTQEKVHVLLIVGLHWHGPAEIRVECQTIFHALGGNGATLVMKREDGKWRIVDVVNRFGV